MGALGLHAGADRGRALAGRASRPGPSSGSRLGPLLLEEGSRSPYAPLSALIGALVVGGVLASGLELLGFHLRRRLGERFGLADGLGGALLVAALGLALAWMLGAVALQTPGARELREPIQRSVVLRELNSVLPPSGPLLKALARFDPFPSIDGPSPDVRPPDARIARDPEVRAAGQQRGPGDRAPPAGSGCRGRAGWPATAWWSRTPTWWPARTTPRCRSRARASASMPRRSGSTPRTTSRSCECPGVSGVPALERNEGARAGTSAAVLGFPENGPYDVRPGRLGQTETVVSQDAYGRGPVRRRITALRGLVRSGNSGGPMVDGQGRVVTTIFAATRRFAQPQRLRSARLHRAGGAGPRRARHGCDTGRVLRRDQARRNSAPSGLFTTTLPVRLPAPTSGPRRRRARPHRRRSGARGAAAPARRRGRRGTPPSLPTLA